jgi:opacity protein-like surface antigen
MWGFGAAYHFNEQWSALMDFTWGSTDMALSVPATPSAGTYRSNADYFNGRLNVEWTPRPGPISPVVSAGIGWNDFRTAVPGAPPQVYCGPSFYYVYWWCTTGVPTYSQTAFAWNAGAGIRWDPTPSFFVKLMYTSTWADFSGVSGTRQFNEIKLQLGGKTHTH